MAVHLKTNGKFNFVVNAHNHSEFAMTGQGLAMGYLAYLLAEEGHNVYVFANVIYPHENIHILKSFIHESSGIPGGTSYSWEQFVYPLDKTIIINSQDQYGNPMGIPNSARWILHDTKKNIEDTWHVNEPNFNYGGFKTFSNKESNQLTAMNFYFDVFKNEKQPNRKGFCHLFHKHTSPQANNFIKELNSKELSTHGVTILDKDFHKKINEEFNKHEYFITYDQKSFWPSVAALCGCKVIVMNSPDNPNSYYDCNVTPEEYRKDNPLNKYGVAFGFEDLQHALDTQHLVGNHLKELDKENKKTVKAFIEFWENPRNLAI